MEQNRNFFRKKSLEKVSSPEQLNDYLHVTTPAVWAVLAAVLILLAGFLFWSYTTTIESYIQGEAEAEDGTLMITFEDPDLEIFVEEGMNVEIGSIDAPVLYTMENEKGRVVAVAEVDVPDGIYDVEIEYKTVQLLRLIFN